MKRYNMYKIKSNDYLKTLFFGIVVISAAFIFKFEYGFELEEQAPILEASKNINPKNDIDIVQNLRKYLNEGNDTTPIIYESMYNNSFVDNNFSDVSMLYMAYNYLSKTANINDYNTVSSCDEYMELFPCEGTTLINKLITKELLNETVYTMFNKTITEYSTFYINSEDACYFINDEYICTKNNKEKSNNIIERELINYNIYDDYVEITEKYSYKKDGILYNSFNMSDYGEQYYTSIFKKENGNYIYLNTNIYF